jgi:hypothetical protein
MDDFGLHDDEFFSFVEAMQDRAGKIANEFAQTQHDKLKAAVLQCKTMLNDKEKLPTSTEKEFRGKMKKYSDAVARHQALLNDILAEFTLPQDSDTQATVAEANVAADRCTEYTCAYVAMTLFRNPTTAQKIRAGDQGQLATLKSVIDKWKQAASKTKDPIFSQTFSEFDSVIAGNTSSSAASSVEVDATPPSAPVQKLKKKKRKSMSNP